AAPPPPGTEVRCGTASAVGSPVAGLWCCTVTRSHPTVVANRCRTSVAPTLRAGLPSQAASHASAALPTIVASLATPALAQKPWLKISPPVKCPWKLSLHRSLNTGVGAILAGLTSSSGSSATSRGRFWLAPGGRLTDCSSLVKPG